MAILVFQSYKAEVKFRLEILFCFLNTGVSWDVGAGAYEDTSFIALVISTAAYLMIYLPQYFKAEIEHTGKAKSGISNFVLLIE